MPSAELAATLKGLLTFRDLSDADIEKLVEASEVLSLSTDEELVVGGAQDAPWYVVVGGRVRLYEVRSGQPRQESAQLVRTGGFFGADYLLFARVMTWKVKAMTDSRLMVVPASKLSILLTQVPALKEGLIQALKFEKLARAHDFSWLGEDEQVKLVVRQHKMFLLVALPLPAVMALISGLIMMYGAGMSVASFGWALVWIGAALLTASVLWLAWRILDWVNDYYVITDYRVVWLEQVLLLYDSRHEALLSSVKTSEVKTSYWGRVFGFGDVIVYALMGQVRFSNIADPQSVKKLIDEQQRAAAASTQREETAAMERIIRRKIDPPPAAQPTPAKPPAPEPKPVRKLISFVPPEQFFQFALREEKNNLITYRQHTIILLSRIWLPSLIEIGLAVGGIYLILQNLAGTLTFPSIPTTILTWMLLAGLVGLWWLYNYMDWRDDLYQIAPDKLISSNRRPLGEETIMTASLANILSMDYQRVGIIGLLFNFGNLEINTGSESKLVFQNILDPSRAQAEISNYLFTMRRKQQLGEQAKELEQISNWLAAYHRQAEDIRRSSKEE